MLPHRSDVYDGYLGKFMNRRRMLLPVAGFLLALGLISCGGGGGGGATTGTGGGTAGDAEVAIALSDLNTQARKTENVSSDWAPVRAKFQSILTTTPANNDAKVGYAISEAAMMCEELMETYGAGYNDPNALPDFKPLISGFKALCARKLTQGEFGPTFLYLTADELPDVVPFTGLVSSDTSFPAFWTLIQRLNTFKPRLESAIAALQSIPANAPATTIADGIPDGSESGANAVAGFGQAERLALLARLQSLRAFVGLACLYNVSTGTYPEGTATLVTFAEEFANSANLSPLQYLPLSPFGDLAADSTERTAIKDWWLAAGTNAKASLEALRNRSGDTILEGLNDSTVDTTKLEVTSFEAAIQGTVNSVNVETPDGPQVISVNLSQFLGSSPPASLRPFFARVNLFQFSEEEYGVELDPTTTIDLTWGGVYPNGLPGTTLEISAIVDSTWRNADLASFGLILY